MNIVIRRGMYTWLVLAMVLAGSLASVGQAAGPAGPAKAYFAGGCFWCMEEVFEKVPGVISVTSGYMGGRVEHPSYEQVSAGGTGHAESVEVVYDPAKVSYTALLDAFWHNVDPVTPNAQFCDHGSQYRAVIFYQGDEEKHLAEESKGAIEQSGRLPGGLLRNSPWRRRFIRPRTITRIFIKRIRSGTNSTNITAGGRSDWKISGGLHDR